MHLNDTVRMSTRKVETPQEVLFRAGRYWAIADNSHVKKVAHENTRYGDVATCRGRTPQGCAGAVVAGLRERLSSRSSKSVIGNSGCRRHVKMERTKLSIH